MATNTRSAKGHETSPAELSVDDAVASAPLRPAAESLKAVSGEAKRKKPGAEPGEADGSGSENARKRVAAAARTVAGKTSAGNAAANTSGSGSERPEMQQRIDPAASRKAAAAFVAARKKMAPAAPSSTTSVNAAKGMDFVTDKAIGQTLAGDAKPVAAPAPEMAPSAPSRPFSSSVQRGPMPPIKPRPAVGGKPQSFKTGEFIVYPAHGVGQITAVESQEVAGYKLELFVISFVKDKMILKVPLPKIASVGMRKLAEPNVMKRALDTLTGRARIKRTMWSRRAQEYEAKINSGDLIAIAEVVRDLYRSDAQPEQSYSERQLYEAALDRMARELGVVQKLTDTEALKVIDDQLQKGPRRGKVEDTDAEDSEDGDEGGIGEAA